MKLNEWNLCAEFDSNGIHERVFSKTYKCLYRLCVCASIREREREAERHEYRQMDRPAEMNPKVGFNERKNNF